MRSVVSRYGVGRDFYVLAGRRSIGRLNKWLAKVMKVFEMLGFASKDIGDQFSVLSVVV
jgi:hypothetical protein